jgi:hypothetical protein
VLLGPPLGVRRWRAVTVPHFETCALSFSTQRDPFAALRKVMFLRMEEFLKSNETSYAGRSEITEEDLEDLKDDLF